MMKKYLLLLSLSLITAISKGQDFDFGTFKTEDINMKKYDKDTSAHAVVLLEHGRCEIARTGDDDINLVYNYHVKIKLFDKSAFESEGTIELPYYVTNGQTGEQIDELKG